MAQQHPVWEQPPGPGAGILWLHSLQSMKVDVELNKKIKLITGTVKSTPTEWLPAISDILPSYIRRQNILLKLYGNGQQMRTFHCKKKHGHKRTGSIEITYPGERIRIALVFHRFQPKKIIERVLDEHRPQQPDIYTRRSHSQIGTFQTPEKAVVETYILKRKLFIDN